MNDQLIFKPEKYEVKSCTFGSRTITFRAFEGLSYCTAPADPIQKLNLYVPECFYRGECVNGYDLHTAPIFMPNTVGGYMAGPADTPGVDWQGRVNTVFQALEHGYVVACAGVRGRNSGKKSREFFIGGSAGNAVAETGKFCGKAPALIVDMKAAIRYLRHNKDTIPGDPEKIITNGTSAGGALSAMAGATGNSPDYVPYLKEIGAADERDDIFAVSCYCPIHNLENADAAYEWLFCGENDYHSTRFVRENRQGRRIFVDDTMTVAQQQISRELKALFPAYLNSLQLKDESGAPLTLDENGDGSFRDYVRDQLLRSAQKELETHDSALRLKELAVTGSEVERQAYLTIENGKAVGLDWAGYVKAVTRMKTAPAFDALDLNSPENQEFGTQEIPAQHFTQYAYEKDPDGKIADKALIQMLNPTLYIGSADTAPHWRIRHGVYDRDTSLAIPTILALLLRSRGYDVDFFLPWGLPHSGDYDTEQLFRWIDDLCKKKDGNAMANVNDLRTALALLETMHGQLVQTDVPVKLHAELSGVYRYVGAGGTVKRPTAVDGPAMIFNNIEGIPGARVLIGLLASRKRCAAFFGCNQYELPKVIYDCVNHPLPPVVTDTPASCQEVVYRADDPDFDLNRLIPAPTNTPVDAGPFITMGMCYATNPDTGLSDITIHRMCIQSRDEISIFLQPGSRHIGAMAERANELGVPLPISVSIGVDPAIEILSCFEPPTTPLGYNELSIAGALRGEPVKLANCLTIPEKAIANAEYVIEGEIVPGVRLAEDQHSHTGFAMPEFPGYNGKANTEAWLIKVKAVTTRKDPIMQTCIGPSEEHVNMAGLPTEASIWGMVEKAMPGKLTGIYAHRAGGGKYMAVLQFKKTDRTDEGRQRQAALLAFSAFPELKHVILVDEDVDIYDSNDVLWAMNTRFQGDRDIITIPGVRCHPLDPSARPEYSGSIADVGISCKTIFDCTVPFNMKDSFIRAPFLEVDPKRWLPDLE